MSAQAVTPDIGSKSTPAAYVSFKTFLSVIDALGQGVPKRIDRTMWRNQSGVIQSQIMMSLRFFNLVDEEDKPTPVLHRLVDAPTEKRQEQIGALLRYAYHDIIEHDLTKMTPKMLDEMMENYHVNGDTKRKAVSFFLQAARFADLPMHPLLSGVIRNSSPRPKRKKKGTYIGDLNGRAEIQLPTQAQGNSKIVRMASGGTVTLSISADPFTLSAEDREFVFALVDKLQEYEQKNPDENSEEERDQ
jgi:hypothetical protein